jgi:hypothetical protein
MNAVKIKRPPVICVHCERTYCVTDAGLVRHHRNHATGNRCQGAYQPADKFPLAPLAVAAMISVRMDRLRETANELRAGAIHPAHAANRIEKIANEIAKAKETK